MKITDLVNQFLQHYPNQSVEKAHLQKAAAYWETMLELAIDSEQQQTPPSTPAAKNRKSYTPAERKQLEAAFERVELGEAKLQEIIEPLATLLNRENKAIESQFYHWRTQREQTPAVATNNSLDAKPAIENGTANGSPQRLLNAFCAR